MRGTYLSPSLSFYKHTRSNNNSCLSGNLGSAVVRDVGISFLLLSALLAGLLLQRTLHSICFASCNHSDPSVLAAGKSHSQTEILANTSTHPEKTKQLLKNNGTYSATFTVVILNKAGKIHYHCFSWFSQLTFIGLTPACPPTCTKSHPHKFNYTVLYDFLRCHQHLQNLEKYSSHKT